MGDRSAKKRKTIKSSAVWDTCPVEGIKYPPNVGFVIGLN